jgi:hypothetical protein
LAVDFLGEARWTRSLLLSNRALIEGRPVEGMGQGAEMVQFVWTGVEKWTNGDGVTVIQGIKADNRGSEGKGAPPKGKATADFADKNGLGIRAEESWILLFPLIFLIFRGFLIFYS